MRAKLWQRWAFAVVAWLMIHGGPRVNRVVQRSGVILIPSGEWCVPQGIIPLRRWRWSCREKREEQRMLDTADRYDRKEFYAARGWPVMPGQSAGMLDGLDRNT